MVIAERPVASAANNGATIIALIEPDESVAHARDDIAGQGVQFVRSIDGDKGDAVIGLSECFC